MQPPEFWSGQARGRDAAPLLQAIAAPLSWLYAAGAASRRAWTKPAKAPVPILCVGNLTLGGAGKTPVARALRKRLDGAHVLLRGYGGAARGPLRVTLEHTARDVGDEALLHARDGPAWVARDRMLGAAAAVEGGARCVILDDGFQNPTLAKDLSLIVVDAEAGIGNGRVFPAGPLRERLRDGLARADAFILMGEGAAQPWMAETGKQILKAALAPVGAPPAGPVVAFAGIARPQKFFDTLTGLGVEIAEAAPYPDHHAFGAAELAWLEKLAQERGAVLITTEKDHVRLPPEARARVAVLKVEARFADEAALDALLQPFRA